MIPSHQECLLLLERYGVPDNIVQHSQMVCKVALSLCRFLNPEGAGLDCAMVEAGSLLHDISKMESLHNGTDHARAGAGLIHRLGYPEVAEIVRQHVIMDDEAWDGPIREPGVVYYADKRVKHTEIVSMEERFRDLKERYGKSPSAEFWIEELNQRCRRLEARIFQKIPVSPEMLSRVL